MTGFEAPNISIVLIAFNEEKQIGSGLRSILSLSRDIVVVDSGSCDGTVSIARNLGARVFQREWPGFGLQKQFAVEQARHDWVLVMDADEILLPESLSTIRKALADKSLPAGFRLPRRNYLHDKHIQFGDWGRDRVLRLVNRRQGHFTPDLVHERWETSGRVADLNAPLAHYSFENYKAMLAKLDHYSDLNAARLLACGRRVRAHEPLAHAAAAFLKGYVARLGFLDGTEGAAIALTSALGSFMKYAKALEMQNQQTDERAAR
ncbi:glycosyltransferase family 2 protein [Thermithiobacillus plumbiphilus]|uniref:Glycosyltransferase family 2 protein n=1 Tax=Thermithiobacillus plumbiphilus TaxID=1729899 RepID=A0ABU9DBA1_9PROT